MRKKVVRKRTQISTTMNAELYKRLQNYSNETDIPMSRLFDRAVEQYLESNKLTK